MRMSLSLAATSMAFFLCATGFCLALDKIELPAPAKAGGVSLAQALAERHSSREFTNIDLTPQQLSDLLWSVAGVNRQDGRKTYPVARNRQDMVVYVVNRQGAYRYNSSAHSLEPVAEGDHRAETGTQPFVAEAAVNLAYVQDMGFWSDSPEQFERGRDWGFAHTGAIMQNAYLYATGQGWSAVARGMFDQERLRALLKLTDQQSVRLVQSIGPKR